ncbi:MAG: LLM class flavin-dependent oxidoreductase [Dehalococcoidia bacterium]
MDEVQVGISAVEDGAGVGDLAALVEKLGFDSIWAGEHITNFGPVLSSVPVVATFAARTSTIKVGTSVMLFPLRHPTVIAKEVSSLDILSGGRVIFGIGVGGENPKEFEACGVNVKERGSRTNEGLELIRKLWTGDKITHKGHFFDMEGVVMEPRPVQRPGPPIYVAGRRDAAMRRAAIHGDGWLPYFYDPDRYRGSVARIRGVAEETGKDLSSFHWALFQFIAVENSYEEALEVAIQSLEQSYIGDFTTIAPKYVALGTPSQCIERLYQYHEAGARHFILTPIGSRGKQRAKIELLAEELLPQIRKF